MAVSREAGDAEAATRAVDAAAHRVTVEIDIPRVTAFPLEPRGAIAAWRAGRLHYRASTQNPFALRDQIAKLFGWAESTVQVVAADVGGSFGLKGYMTREDAALAFGAHALGAEVAWLSTRSEAFVADAQGRGVTGAITLGLNDDLTIAGLQAELEIDVGAYPGRRSFGVMNNINGITGMYRIPHVAARIAGRLSARAPLAPFRGNGRPEATHAIERVLDKAARKLGADPVELRRANLIGPAEMPCVTGLGTNIDCGDFPRVMDAAIGLATGVDARRAAAQARGRLHGFGLANCIESAGGPLRAPKPDYARLTVGADGRVRLAPGVMSVGQGHETGLTRMVAERLEIDPERIDYAHGDTEAITHGRGSGGSSGLTVAGSALALALEDLLAEGRAEAAGALGCEAAALDYRKSVTASGNETFEAERSGTVSLTFADEGMADLTFDPGDKARRVGSFPAEVGNPLIMYFLETVIRDLAQTAGGSPFYIRNRIKAAVISDRPVEDQEISLGGRTVTARTVTLHPFENDPAADKMRGIETLALTFVVSEEVPGWLYSLKAETTTDRGDRSNRPDTLPPYTNSIDFVSGGTGQ